MHKDIAYEKNADASLILLIRHIEAFLETFLAGETGRSNVISVPISAYRLPNRNKK